MIETPARITPTALETISPDIADAIAELAATSAVLGQALHPRTAASLADLVRIMNTYYSNLIEGHNTRPRDIQRALTGDFDADDERRDLQVEAKAHVYVQSQIDAMAVQNSLPEPASRAFILWLHREFYKDAPASLLQIEGDGRSSAMIAGEWRNLPEHDVTVGRHIPPSSAAVSEFMGFFERSYGMAALGQSQRMMAMAAAHHRLNFIHPFVDGNGRVSRLMSHAMAHKAGIAAHGLWSVSRGLARGLESRGEYKQMMDYADSPRRGDLDGRGNLSHAALADFILWFLRICIDQVSFMSSMFEVGQLSGRLKRLVASDESLKPQSAWLLEQLLLKGEIDRGEAGRIMQIPERSARRVLNDLQSKGLIGSVTSKGPISLRFPAEMADVLFPRLFHEL